MGKLRTISTQVMVASAQKNLCEERMRVCGVLWNAGIKVSSYMMLQCIHNYSLLAVSTAYTCTHVVHYFFASP